MSEGARALVASPTDAAQTAARDLRERYDWVAVEDADLVIALGGDGFMLQTLHAMLERRRIVPVFGMNLGTVGFLMNEWRFEGLEARLERIRPFKVTPLKMIAETISRRAHHQPGDQRNIPPPRNPPDGEAGGDGQRPHRHPRIGLRRRAGGHACRVNCL